MPLSKETIYTIKDIYDLPEGQRAELIDGQIYDMAPPNRMHQKISTRLESVIDTFLTTTETEKYILLYLQYF